MENKIEMLKTSNNSGLSYELVDGIINTAFGGEESFLEQYADVANYGGDKGNGFIYYDDTSAFYAIHAGDLKLLAEYDAEQFTGSSSPYSVCEMLADFKISKQNDLEVDHWLEFLYNAAQYQGGASLDKVAEEWYETMMKWIMCVYASEQTCRALLDIFDADE